MLSFAIFSMLVVNTASRGLGVLAVAAVFLLVVATTTRTIPEDREGLPILLALVVVFVIIYGSLWYGLVFPGVRSVTMVPLPFAILMPGIVIAVILIAGSVTGFVNSSRRSWSMALILVLYVFWVGWASIYALETPDIDVLELHQSAGNVLTKGLNPYVYAGVELRQPWTEAYPQWEAGYAYPPTTMVPYALASAYLGDARWVSVIAIALAVLMIARSHVDRTPGARGIDLLIALALAIQHGNLFVFSNGWTEPLALPFLVLAIGSWARNSTVSSISLGLLISTKQYFVMAFPLLLGWRDAGRWRRLVIVVVSGLVVSVPLILWDVRGFVDSAIIPILQLGPRADSSNLYGLGIEVPRWIAIGIPIAAGFGFGRFANGPSGFAASLGSVFGLQFLLGFAAFANYWLLVGALALLTVWAENDRAIPRVHESLVGARDEVPPLLWDS